MIALRVVLCIVGIVLFLAGVVSFAGAGRLNSE
jgi:hypothetical protein